MALYTVAFNGDNAIGQFHPSTLEVTYFEIPPRGQSDPTSGYRQ